MSEELKKKRITEYVHRWHPVVEKVHSYATSHDTLAMNIPGGALVCMQLPGSSPSITFVPNVVLMESPDMEERMEEDEADGDDAFVATRSKIEFVYDGETLAKRKAMGWKVLR